MKKTTIKYEIHDGNVEVEPRYLLLDTQKLNINTIQELQEYLELQKIEYVESQAFESDLDERILEAMTDAQEASLSYGITMDKEDLETLNEWHKNYIKYVVIKVVM